MFKLLKNLEKKDFGIILLVTIIVILSVYLDLKMPEYMSEITKLVQTKDSSMNEILKSGGFMMICAIISLGCTIVVGYLTSLLSARFSRNIRRKIFEKVESFGITEMKKFTTASLITRTTNDVTQIEMLLAMGLQLLIKSPVMAVWALIKILGKSSELSMVTGIGVVIIVVANLTIIKIVTPRFAKIQTLTDKMDGVTRESSTGIRVV
ncbi:MAG: ABC transporter ATP-binding protein, partial [Bacilli bacterium]|nr:ABC transporter ATP-binding protein [Bacilli bacterium]